MVSVWAARIGFLRWCGAARARGRAREGMKAAEVVWRRKGLAGAVKGLRRFTVMAARQRRADRTKILRRSFVALRQVRVSEPATLRCSKVVLCENTLHGITTIAPQP